VALHVDDPLVESRPYRGSAAPVAAQDDLADPSAAFHGGSDHGRACAVREEGRRSAVALVHEAAQHLGADDQHVLAPASLDLGSRQL
jgi:hypothetical protein